MTAAFCSLPLTACEPKRRCPQIGMCARVRTRTEGEPPGRLDFSVTRSENAPCLMFIDVRGLELYRAAA